MIGFGAAREITERATLYTPEPKNSTEELSHVREGVDQTQPEGALFSLKLHARDYTRYNVERPAVNLFLLRLAGSGLLLLLVCFIYTRVYIYIYEAFCVRARDPLNCKA